MNKQRMNELVGLVFLGIAILALLSLISYNPGDVAFFQKGNLKHFMFKNETPGSNTKIVAVATVPTEALREVLK